MSTTVTVCRPCKSAAALHSHGAAGARMKLWLRAWPCGRRRGAPGRLGNQFQIAASVPGLRRARAAAGRRSPGRWSGCCSVHARPRGAMCRAGSNSNGRRCQVVPRRRVPAPPPFCCRWIRRKTSRMTIAPCAPSLLKPENCIFQLLPRPIRPGRASIQEIGQPAPEAGQQFRGWILSAL